MARLGQASQFPKADATCQSAEGAHAAPFTVPALCGDDRGIRLLHGVHSGQLSAYLPYRRLPYVAARTVFAELLRCKLGLEHFGRQFSEIGRLHDLGLDYIKWMAFSCEASIAKQETRHS